MALKLFNLPKARQFKYTPIYYNEQKEELEQQIKKAKRELGMEVNDPSKPYVPNIKGQMRGYFKQAVKQKRKANYRLVLVFLALIVIAYLLLYY